MGLFNKTNVTTTDDGKRVYTKALSKKDQKKLEKNESNNATIDDLKANLEKNYAIQWGIQQDILDPNQPPLEGDQQKRRLADQHEAARNVNKFVKDLRKYGVTAIHKNGHVTYKEGGDKMAYTRAEMLGMKVDVINESAAGNLSKPAASYMLNYIDLMIEKGDCDDKECLVSQYLDAAKEGDKDEKEKLMKKIKNADKSIDEMLGDKYDDLSDDDKEVVDKLKDAIEGNDGDGEDGGEKSEDSEDDKETKESADEDVEDDPTGEEGDATDSKKDEADAGSDTEVKEFVSLSQMSRDALNDYVTESVASGRITTESANTILNAIRRR